MKKQTKQGIEQALAILRKEEAHNLGFIEGKQEAQAEEIKFLKSIKFGTSYCWMNDEIVKRIKTLKEKK